MKTLLATVIITFLFFDIALCQTAQRPKYAPRKAKHRNETDELHQKQGEWKFYNANHQLTNSIEYQNNIRVGFSRLYFPNQKVFEETEYQYGLKEGSCKKYYYSGNVHTDGQYMAGKKSEVWTTYYSNGVVKSEGSYLRGNKEGKWNFYNQKSQFLHSISYKGGKDLAESTGAEKKSADAKKAADAKKKTTVKPVIPKSGRDTLKK